MGVTPAKVEATMVRPPTVTVADLKVEDIDGHRFEVHVAQPEVAQLLGQVQRLEVIGPGPRQAESQLRVGACHGRQVPVHGLGIPLCEDLVQGLVEGGGGGGQRGRGKQQQDQQTHEWNEEPQAFHPTPPLDHASGPALQPGGSSQR